MRVLNKHSRLLPISIAEFTQLFATLATDQDQIWPKHLWPKMKFKDGLSLGNKGGHGPIRYQVVDFNPELMVRFKFLKPSGFEGYHTFIFKSTDASHTLLDHTIEMETKGRATLYWICAIKHLHDALIEDTYDKIESKALGVEIQPSWNMWVRILRVLVGLKIKR